MHMQALSENGYKFGNGWYLLVIVVDVMRMLVILVTKNSEKACGNN